MIFIFPRSSHLRRESLLVRIVRMVNLMFVTATSCTNCLFFEVRSPVVWGELTPHLRLASMAVILPYCTPSMADLIAPQSSCPKTSITFAPLILQAYSRLPNISVLAKLPATRATNRSPIPRFTTYSEGTRESRHDKIAAIGYWPLFVTRMRILSFLGVN